MVYILNRQLLQFSQVLAKIKLWESRVSMKEDFDMYLKEKRNRRQALVYLQRTKSLKSADFTYISIIINTTRKPTTYSTLAFTGDFSLLIDCTSEISFSRQKLLIFFSSSRSVNRSLHPSTSSLSSFLSVENCSRSSVSVT